MKTFLKISLLAFGVLFVCGKLFEYLDHRNQKDPWLHVGCKLAYVGKMGGKPCEVCLSRYNAKNQKILNDVLKKWERARGKPFTISCDEDLKEMIQIMKNHGIGKIFED